MPPAAWRLGGAARWKILALSWPICTEVKNHPIGEPLLLRILPVWGNVFFWELLVGSYLLLWEISCGGTNFLEKQPLHFWSNFLSNECSRPLINCSLAEILGKSNMANRKKHLKMHFAMSSSPSFMTGLIYQKLRTCQCEITRRWLKSGKTTWGW